MAKDQQKDFTESVQRQIDKGKTHYEGNRADAEKKIQRILELIKSESQRKKRGSKNSRRDSELVGLIEDFHKEYQSLYELCDRLQEQGKSVYGSEAQSSWSFSSLDSEYFSSEEVGSSPRKKELSNVDELRNNSRHDLDNADIERERDREVTILKKKLVSARQEREALDFEYKKSLSKIEELENTLNELTTEADGRIKELSTLRQEHRALGTKSSARTKELEAQLTSLKVELDSLCSQKRKLEGYLKSQATEIRQLKEKNKGLQSHVLELELISKDRANQISSLMKKIKDIEKETSFTASELNAQVRSLQFELKTTYAQKCELEQRAEQLVDKDKDYSYQLEVLRNELNDSASQIESKNKEISEYCKQLESLKEELQLKTGEAQRGMDVNKKLTMKVNDLKLELEALTEHENELEEQLRNRVQETLLVRNEKEGLDAKVVELERSLAEMGNEVSALQDKLKAEKDSYTKSTSMLKTRVINLQEEVEALNAQRRKLELRSEIDRRESPRKAIYVENKGFQLTSKTSIDQGALSSDQEDSSVGSRSSRRHRITKNLSPDLDLQLVERKMEEYTEDYRMKIEDNMRILGQRILVIEHLHLETKESYKLNKECFHQGSKMLKECAMAHKSDLMKLKDASIMANDALIWLDLVIRTFEDRSNKIITRVSNAMKELQFIKAQLSNCNSEDEMSCQSQKIDNNQELEVLKESTQELSARLEGEVKEKLHLVKVADELDKKVQELENLVRERDQGILSVGEEKREAIRQLCFLVDYHRGRCDQYREVILKITSRRSKRN